MANSQGIQQPESLTVGQVAEFYGAPPWLVRRIVDRINSGLPRAGQYRLIPRGMLPAIGAALNSRGQLAGQPDGLTAAPGVPFRC